MLFRSDILAMLGMPVTDATKIEWEGGGEGVETKPRGPRVHKKVK